MLSWNSLKSVLKGYLLVDLEVVDFFGTLTNRHVVRELLVDDKQNNATERPMVHDFERADIWLQIHCILERTEV